MLKLQQELWDAVRKVSMSVAPLEVKPRYGTNAEAETKDLQSLEKIRSQVCVKWNLSTIHVELINRKCLGS